MELTTNKVYVRSGSVIPGFGITSGITLFYLSLVLLLPIGVLFFRVATADLGKILAALTDARVVAAYKLTFSTAFLAASANAVFGLLVAWVLVRYEFPGRKILDAVVDLPFALPTAVAGISLTAILAPNGIGGQVLGLFGIRAVFTPLGIIVALTFIGLPFVVRMVQPVLEDIEKDVEEAAASLGATRAQVFVRIIVPAITPALLAGFALSFARGLGEYGSVVFISGNMPFKTEIVPLLIMTKLEQYDYASAMSVAVVMLIVSFILLLVINVLQRWAGHRITA